jgi:hypothetical protein
MHPKIRQALRIALAGLILIGNVVSGVLLFLLAVLGVLVEPQGAKGQKRRCESPSDNAHWDDMNERQAQENRNWAIYGNSQGILKISDPHNH